MIFTKRDMAMKKLRRGERNKEEGQETQFIANCLHL